MPTIDNSTLPHHVEQQDIPSEIMKVIRAATRPGVKLFLSIDDLSTLTMREWEVLGHLSTGKTPKEIREELRMSKSTLCKHLRAIREAFGAESSGEAIRRAKEQGCIA